MIDPPQKGEPVDELWMKVAEMTKAVNALMAMEVQVTNRLFTTGKIQITDNKATLILS